MLSGRKIDLALEAKELAEGSPQKTTRLSGVKAQEDTLFGYPLTRVDILNQEGEAALGKPKGAYLTLDLPQLPQDMEVLNVSHVGRPWRPCLSCPKPGRFWWPAWATAR